MPRRPRSGRKPKPAKLRVLEGNPGNRPIKDGTVVEPFCPDRPKWTVLLPNATGKRNDPEAAAVRRDAQAAWDSVIVQLDQIGVLGRVDMTTVIDYCLCDARLRQCERLLSREGLTTKHERGHVKHPALTAANQYRTQLRFYVGELGLSPSSRMRLNTTGGGSLDDEDEKELFG